MKIITHICGCDTPIQTVEGFQTIDDFLLSSRQFVDGSNTAQPLILVACNIRKSKKEEEEEHQLSTAVLLIGRLIQNNKVEEQSYKK